MEPLSEQVLAKLSHTLVAFMSPRQLLAGTCPTLCWPTCWF